MDTKNNEATLEAMRHTAAHVLAAASRQLKPETRLGVGPAIENGFYHDIDVDENYTEEDLPKLQAEMEKIKKNDLPITQREIPKDEARELFKDDPFKLELIEEIEGETVRISVMGPAESHQGRDRGTSDGFFVTLCKGGHVSSTGQIGFFQLTHVAGVYWKGDASKPQLQRIYGVSFPTQEELDQHLKNREEAKKRDHRKLGRELDLFTFSPLVGPGLPLFTPRGTIIRREVEQFIWSLQNPFGYQEVTIPHLAKPELYKTSGHWEKFKENLFHVRGAHDEFVIKPMNCPHHTQIYASRPRSYKDLPLRFAELTAVYRDEQAGQLQGLTRVRSITQDDAHVFCREDQMEEEISNVLSIVDQFYAAFDLKLTFRLSLWDASQPEKYLGSQKVWNTAQETLRKVLRDRNVEFFEAEGEAAFYGPKIDFIATDSLGRAWQMATCQLDFNMPARFELNYTTEDGGTRTPIMIHRAISGSIERFIAILLEHYAGALPLWLSPTQTAILPISDDQNEYAKEIAQKLQAGGVRVQVDERSESIGKKIREAEVQKVPVILIVGKKEMEAGTVALRRRGQGDMGAKSVEEISAILLGEIRSKS